MPSPFDPMFATAATAPHRYGESPWHVRGHAHANDLAFVEQHVPGGVAAVARRLGDAELERFYKQRFAASTYYDVMPGQVLGVGVARVLGFSHDTFLRRVAEQHAAAALKGFTGVVLRALSPETLAGWMPRMVAAYNDFGTIRTTTLAPGHVRGVRNGVPQPLVGSTARFSLHFLEAILAGVGARGVAVHALAMEREPDAHGHPHWSIAFEVRWTT